jgi:hypothetical protein
MVAEPQYDWTPDADETEEPDALGTYGPEGVAICQQCSQLADFVYLDEARGQARGVCSRCGADWWL